MKKKITVGILFIMVAITFFVYKNSKQEYDKEIILGDTIIGDVDGNGKVASNDYILVRKYILGQISLTSSQLERANVNGDKTVSAADYIIIRKIILGLYTPPSPGGDVVYKDSTVKIIDNKYSYIVADVDVSDYGADPTGVKDSTKAFKDALYKAYYDCVLDASKKCGGTVYVPKGKYKLTEQIEVPTYVSLIGESQEGTVKDGTILMLYHGKNSTDPNQAAIRTNVFASIQNIAFWYPDQAIDANGNAIAYPPTIAYREGTDGITLENLYFVNSYTAMDLGSFKYNNSIFFIRNIYGTPLDTGIMNDTNLDTIKMTNINFSPKYWLNSGLPDVPTKDSLSKVLMNFTKMPSAIILRRVDWFILSNINIDGYFFGIKLEQSARTGDGAEGQIYDSKIIDCYHPIYVASSKHMAITSTTLSAKGGSLARGLHINEGNEFNYSIYGSNISSTGDFAIYYGSKRSVSITGSTINGRIGKSNSPAYMGITGSKLTNTGYDNCSVADSVNITKKTYDKRVVTKPGTKNLIKLKVNNRSDITNELRDAISKLAAVGGGIVYLPTGTYDVSGGIDVLSGVEIRGTVAWAHFGVSDDDTTTKIRTYYKGGPLFTLENNAGLNGLDIIYPENRSNKDPVAYPYSIKGNGKNIYVINVSLTSSWNGIDLSSSRCDNHYIEHIWGVFFNKGIVVGGESTNGVIRDSHFTPNVLRNATYNGIKTVLVNQTLIEIGPSNNEVLFNIFAFGPSVGFYFNGAKDFYSVCTGIDFANDAIKISGGATGQIINPLLVSRPYNTATYSSTLTIDTGIPGANNHYIVSTNDFTGFVQIFNPIMWGNPFGIAMDLAGKGNIHLVSGIVENSNSPAINLSNSLLSVTGVVFRYNEEPSFPDNTIKFRFNKGIKNVYLAGNVCDKMKTCTQGLINNAGINYGNIDANISCVK